MSIATRHSAVPILTGLTLAGTVFAQSVITTTSVPPADPPSIAVSLLRLTGALALVLAVFFGGIWMYRNWQRLAVRAGHGPKLQVIDAKSLGHRHALYVVAYEQQRLLLACAPTGITLLTHLPSVDPESAENSARPRLPVPQFTFVEALQNVIGRKR